MKKLDLKIMAINAMIAGVYTALTFVLSPIAYGDIQMRFSEIIIFLAFYNKKYIPGLVIGCLIANMFSPMGLWDICFGTFATILACIAMYYLRNLYLGAIAGAMFNGLIVGFELYMVFELPYIMSAFSVFIGELVVLLIGAYIFQWIEKNESIMKKYILE